VSAGDPAPAPFLIITALGDGTVAQIPAANYGELDELLERMARVCEDAGVAPPATGVWRMDRSVPRPMSRPELEEGNLRRLGMLAC
jgi:hypothetical protein